MTISPSTSKRISADNLNSILITHPVASPYPVFIDFPTQKKPSSLCQHLSLLPYPRKFLKHKVAFALAHLKNGRPWRLSDKEPACPCGRPASGARAGKVPWRRKRQPHSSLLACRIPWAEEPGGLQSTGSQELDTTEHVRARVHTHTRAHTHTHGLTPSGVFLLGTWR